MTTAEQSVATVLDETIAALSALDHERLLSLEKRILRLAKSGAFINGSMPSLLHSHTLLKRMLDETSNNLAVLSRLHGSSTWAR
jgi:hypothetical protein